MPVNRNEQRQPHVVHINITQYASGYIQKHIGEGKYAPIGRNVASFFLIDVLNFPDSTQSEQKRKLRLLICPPVGTAMPQWLSAELAVQSYKVFLRRQLFRLTNNMLRVRIIKA